MPYDTVVRNGTVVIPGHGELAATIAIQNGRIAGLLEPGIDAPAHDTIDARGKYVFPGLVDPHVHLAYMGQPFSQYETETRSAAIGGVTTLMNYLVKPSDLDAPFHEEVAEVEKIAYVDFALHFGALTEEQIAHVPRYIEQFGVSSFKFHMNFRYEKDPHKERFNALGFESIDDGLLYELFSQVARHPGAIVNVHAETAEITWRLEARVRAAGGEGQSAWNEARPSFVEGNAVRTACYLAQVTGCPLYVVHMSTRDGLEEVRRARRHHRPIYVETCSQYYTLHTQAGARVTGKIPPLRPPEDAEAVWQAILDGTIDTIATDHNGRKKMGGDNPSVWNVGPSFPGIATTLPLLLSEGVHKRGLSLRRVAELTSFNAARIFNLYPRKGTIQPGSDADLVIVDLDQERAVDPAYLQSESDFSLWEGWVLRGWPQRTIVRGKTVMADGKIVGEKGFGRYQRRDLAPPAGA